MSGKYVLQQLAEGLKAARQRKGLSQQALGERAGIPQSQISRIERGAVDLRTSTLMELARVLDLEVRLVPRRALPAVDSLIRSTPPKPQRRGSSPFEEHPEVRERPRPAYSLEDEDDD
jgi:HTH-type transcriptional regulator/antitoxin HipB